MEDKVRPFQAVKIGMTSVEIGDERFSGDATAQQAPTQALWRINLTALSQRHDLYFIACLHEIYVYKPQFPYQKLGRTAACVLAPQLANPGASGYISPTYPHSINHLIVGNLGDQEILLVATDSGNVTAYHTQSILRAILEYKIGENDNSVTSTYRDVRPFFMQWVGESAWALSIHTEGRMVAVSANTPAMDARRLGHVDVRASITVFAFALECNIDADESRSDEILFNPESNGFEPEWHTWDADSAAFNCSSPNRDRNYKIILSGPQGHAANVPSITFLNSEEDRQGSWLLSTDIDEDVKMWQIWTGSCVRTWRFRDNGATGAAWLEGHERGWTVAALDKRSFQPAASMESFIGYHRAPMYHGYASPSQGQSFDITNVVRHHVPSNSLFHPLNAAENDDYNEDDDDDDNNPQIFEDLTDSESAADEADLARIGRIRLELESISPADNPSNSNFSSPGPQFNDTSHEAVSGHEPDVDEDSEDESEFGVESNFSIDNLSDLEIPNGSRVARNENTITSIMDGVERAANHNLGISTHVDILDESDSTELLDSNHQLKPVGKVMRPQSSQASSISIPDMPFIYCSASHLRLFSSTNQKSPHLFCARLLRQTMGPIGERDWVAQIDRLAMVQQISELGILVIATQSGRCAVCTLTKRKSDGLVGLRVDWVLPTKKQEKAGLRPHVTLQGIAVGPIQGREPTNTTSRQETQDLDRLIRKRSIDGVPTTFDRTAIDLSRSPSAESLATTIPSVKHSSTSNRVSEESQHAKTTGCSRSRTKLHDWTKGKAPEPWKAADESRRYRLMLTYIDCTVLTYEIYRGVERHDTRPD